MENTFEKHRYQIHIRECAKSVLSKLAEDSATTDEIYQRYKSRLVLAIIEYYKTTSLVKESSKEDVFKMSIVDVIHPSFNFWFALFITTKKSFEVPLILDAYSNGDFGIIENFRGNLQFLILNIIRVSVIIIILLSLAGVIANESSFPLPLVNLFYRC